MTPNSGQQASKQNLETKVSVTDLALVRARCQAAEAIFQWRRQQIDTYFDVLAGRLKLREEEDTEAVLIAYSRPDVPIARWSQYVLYPVSDPPTLKYALSISPGIRVVVRKHRELWLHARTRIHLDLVDGLGEFVELETVMTSQSQVDIEQEHHHVLQALGIVDHPAITTSYSDLLLKEQP